MIEFLDLDEGVVIPIKAQPGAKRNAIVGEHAGMLKIAVTQKPENGKANEAIIELLSKQLKIAKSKCTLLSGATSRQKRILVSGLSTRQIAERLGVEG